MDEESFAFGSFRLIPAQRVLVEDGKPLQLGSRALETSPLMSFATSDFPAKFATASTKPLPSLSTHKTTAADAIALAPRDLLQPPPRPK